MFTNLKIDPAQVAASLAELQTGFAESGRTGSFEANAVGVIARRLARRPDLYVEFGPYWWAVKRVLVDAGVDLGGLGDAAVAAEYTGSGPAETLVAGELFKDYYRETYMGGANTFALTDDAEQYVLEDADMMARAATTG